MSFLIQVGTCFGARYCVNNFTTINFTDVRTQAPPPTACVAAGGLHHNMTSRDVSDGLLVLCLQVMVYEVSRHFWKLAVSSASVLVFCYASLMPHYNFVSALTTILHVSTYSVKTHLV